MDKFYEEIYGKKIQTRTYYKQYWPKHSLDVSTGLIAGLMVDKALFYLTKGFSLFIPPFAAMWLSKGRRLYTIRYESDRVDHVIRKLHLKK